MLCRCLQNWPRRFLRRLTSNIVSLASQCIRHKLYVLDVVSWKIRKNFIMKEYWEGFIWEGLCFAKLGCEEPHTPSNQKKSKFQNTFFKRLYLGQQNAVITERREVNKMNLCGFSFLLRRRNKLEMANSLSWGNWPVNS